MVRVWAYKNNRGLDGGGAGLLAPAPKKQRQEYLLNSRPAESTARAPGQRIPVSKEQFWVIVKVFCR